jgi:flagellar biosynthesis GTPase FlhF
MATKKLDIELRATGEAQVKRALDSATAATNKLAAAQSENLKGFNKFMEAVRGGGMAIGIFAAARAVTSLATAWADVATGVKTFDDALDEALKKIPIIGDLGDAIARLYFAKEIREFNEFNRRRSEMVDAAASEEKSADAKRKRTEAANAELRRIADEATPQTPHQRRQEALTRILGDEPNTPYDRSMYDAAAKAAQRAKQEEDAKEAAKRANEERKAQREFESQGKDLFSGLASGFLRFGQRLGGAAFVANTPAAEQPRMADIIRTMDAESGRGMTGALAAAREPVQAVIKKTAEDASKERLSIIDTIKFVGTELTFLKNQFMGIRP